MPKNFATLGPSDYSRRLLGFIIKAQINFFFYTCSTGQASASIHLFTNLQKPVFLTKVDNYTRLSLFKLNMQIFTLH